jgi:hypothetical protein
MVPWQTLILLTAGFFIREVYQRSKKTPTDFDSGYRQAIIEICNKWNAINKITSNKCDEHCKLMKKYLQSKLNGGD